MWRGRYIVVVGAGDGGGGGGPCGSSCGLVMSCLMPGVRKRKNWASIHLVYFAVMCVVCSLWKIIGLKFFM